MTTSRISTTIEAPRVAPASVKEQVGEALAARTATRSALDTIKAAPLKARAFLASTVRTLRYSRPGQFVTAAAKWVYSRFLSAARFLRAMNPVAVIGGIFTAQKARETVVSLAASAYRIVRKPFEWLCSGLKWAFTSIGFGWGVQVVEAGEARGKQAEGWVAGKVQAGMDWLADREQGLPMRCARAFFQGGLVARGLRLLFPDMPFWGRLILGALIPTVGDQATRTAIAAEEAAIAHAQEVLGAVPAAEQPKGRPTPKQTKTQAPPTVVPKVIVLRDATNADEPVTFEAVGFVGLRGELRVYLGDQLLLEEDLPDGITVAGDHQGPVDALVQEVEKKNEAEAKRLEQEVRAAQAAPSGRPPTLPTSGPRAARRAPRKAGSGKK